MTFTGKRTFITGASSGIGKATAYEFAKLGSNLILLGRDLDRLQAIAGDIQAAYGVDVQVIAVDATDIPALQTAIAETLAGVPVDIAIINHGIGHYGRVSHSDWEPMQRVLETNILGTFAAAHAVLPSLLAQLAPSIVFITSILDKRPIPSHAAYSASKSAIRTFANVLRLETREQGLHVGVVAPARTNTEMQRRMTYSETPRESSLAGTAPPSDVARAIVRCVQQRRREMTLSLFGNAATFFGYHFPRTTDFFIHLLLKKA